MLFNKVNEYSTNPKNVEILKNNIYLGETYLKSISKIHKGKYKFKQDIYYYI